MKESVVYILGAGCSVRYGYPLARGFLDALKKYGSILDQRPNCDQLKRCVAETVGLMETFNSPTIDRLVLQIEEDLGRQPRAPFGSQDLNYARLENLAARQNRNAKLATAALFNELEDNARKSGLQGYRDFLNTIFEGDRGTDALRSTPNRVLSFNYERLFEFAFIDHFKLQVGMDCYGPSWLNSGFDFSRKQPADIVPDRFSFLKLHGTAAMLVADHYGKPRYGWSKSLSGADQPIDDHSFWPTAQTSSQSPREQPEPLIAFPYEKDRARETNTSFLFDHYIRTIWAAAMQLAASADKLCVIGYSFDPNDRKAILELLRSNRANCDIFVQNPDAERICSEMRLHHSDLTSRLKPLSNLF
ncbi:MAG TPA: hypothetical protein VMR33_05365 [Candidatus Baltobacteraceae bacterium]|nr:hypothetical protein [Candidatus Baltobacteraceae bacterium]